MKFKRITKGVVIAFTFPSEARLAAHTCITVSRFDGDTVVQASWH